MSSDPRLDRRVQFDERSREFPVRTLVEARKPRSYTWRCLAWLDQGSEGACVGYSVAHELAARPFEATVDDTLARGLYDRAREVDEWPGEDYEGTSVLAGIKAAGEAGYFSGYRWAFSLEDLILAIGYTGPAVLGLNWHERMLEPDENGWVHPTGEIVGGHAILCRGISLRHEAFVLHNSWGPRWGVDGCCFIGIHELGVLLKDQGEACIPIGRMLPAG